MNLDQSGDFKALVIVFNSLQTAKTAVEKLFDSKFKFDKIELVTNDIQGNIPEVQTPKVHETTSSASLDSMTKWGTIGAGTGLLAGLLTGFPGLVLGMTVAGGLTGSAMGGVAGVDHAVTDDSVDLPTIAEYDKLIRNGDQLVVVLGIHEEVMRVEEIVKDTQHIRCHIHPVHGHEYHEHPARKLPARLPIR